MIKLITDTSCLFSVEQAKQMGFIVNPLSVAIDGKTYREFEEINAQEFIEKINQGFIPISSQPAMGEILDSIEANIQDEIILLTMADGLSGTYNTCLSAASHFENAKIHVVNSKTLCGPHQYLVEMILKMIKDGKDVDTILNAINEKIATVQSFLMPSDFNYLKRGGRCTPLAAALGGLLKIQPVVMQTKDGKRLDKFATCRSFDLAVKKIIAHYDGKLHDHILYISHAFSLDKAQKAKALFEAKFSGLDVRILDLSCAFITQGGPGCVAIQSIAK
ncbi:MAG: DegV family protein [Erysipelotrichaceae bacterium]|nr:DegV family protein [Erysipelotrichaceae bacterium]MDY5251374.1 DegV family protein [Erysipelotrichaceae bacterium]